MRRSIIIAAVVLTTAAATYLLYQPQSPSVRIEAGSAGARERVPPPPAKAREAIIVLPIATEMTPLNSPETTVDEDLGTIELLISEFAKHNGGNPVGENVEITAALMGENPKHLAYLPSKGPFLDSAGQLIDRWGTPYFFHQLSATQTEIMSAGPDRQFNTGDDLKR